MPTSEALRASPTCIDLIMESEGFRAKPYEDCAGYLTVGYGHKVTSREFDKGIDRAQAYALLAIDVAAAEADVNRLVKVPLTQGQFDALVDFTFNMGVGRLAASTLLAKLNAGDYAAVPDQLYRVDPDGTKHGWILAGGQVEPGLVQRRQDEIKLWRGI